MLRRIEVALRPHVVDTVGRKTAANIRESLQLDVTDVRLVHVFTVDGLDDGQLHHVLEASALHDPVLQSASLSPATSDADTVADWILEVGFRPGVTDNEGRTARETLAVVLGVERETVNVFTGKQYHLYGNLSHEEATSIGRDLLANELIQRFELVSGEEWKASPGFTPFAARVSGKASDEVATIPITTMSDDEMLAFSRENTLALSLEELQTIKAYYLAPSTIARRKAMGLAAEPCDAEIEALAQTWSEHCKHKIFASRITYTNTETGGEETIDSLYKTYIQGSTATLRNRMAENDFCRSVFKDNAGVITFNDSHDICIKVETHNSPSALDPYGGALTGIVGVNRDPMGTGMGADLVCNMDVFCFASPFHTEELPPRLLHPRRVLEGVREGVEHGGNKSGIPTINGSIVFEDRFLGKPLVYCGTVGMIPKEVAGKPGYTKQVHVGDIIVMAGGRIGKDGIHGATFSSEELHEESPATAVQIGDPITQRKLYDFTMAARNKGLYNAITDNGAGGLSSSVGEMAEGTGGCRMDLAKAPLKYDGLRPWEILLSEAQERMTYAVSPEHITAFLALASEMDVEATALGEFTDSGYFHITYGDKNVAYLDMEFLHDGVPQMQLEAVWKRPEHTDTRIDVPQPEQGELLKRMLGRLNICSKEYVIRQYDHEVKGGSVIKPLVGVKRDGPADAGVVRPVLEDTKGIALSHGICPRYSDYDTYWMMANAIDEAVRNAVAVGADIDHMAGVDNFCWCDPVQSEKTPDGHYKLAQLVRANQALAHYCLAYGVPCVSGKDSMKNDYTGGGQKISIPPTVLFSVLGVVPDIEKTMTSDFKNAGDTIYLLGSTSRELGGSELAEELGVSTAHVPQVDALAARTRYRTLFKAINSGLISACHDCSDGGLGVALAEMALAGRLGCEVDLACAQRAGDLTDTELLYSESASRLLVSVPQEHATSFEALFVGQACSRLGTVTDNGRLSVSSGGSALLDESVEDLAVSFKSTLSF